MGQIDLVSAGESEASAAEDCGWVLRPDRLRKELERTGFREEMIEHLAAAAERAVSLVDAPELLQRILTDAVNGVRIKPRVPDYPLFPALAMIAGFPSARALHQARGIPEAVTKATFCDLERSLEAYRDEHAVWGFNNAPWLRHHLTGGLFELGRLQYQPGTMGMPYRIYRHRDDASLIAIASNQICCTSEGLPQKEATGFCCEFILGDHKVTGHPVLSDSGRISPRPVEILLSHYELIAEPASRLLFVHIPKGERLTVADCDESLRRAEVFFSQYFPEMDWQGYGCISWLLDPELRKCLPVQSNILAFASRFFPLAVPNATGSQILERVLGAGADPATFQPSSSLQKAVLEHLRAGGVFRTTGGFIPRGNRNTGVSAFQ